MARYGGDYGRRFGGGMGREWGRAAAYGSFPRSGYDERYDRDWHRGWNMTAMNARDFRDGQGRFRWGYAAADYPDRYAPALPRGAPGRWPRAAAMPGTGDVDRIRAADIMTRNPEVMTADTSLADVARRMRELDVGVMPIVDSEESLRLQGIITDRDIAVRAAAEGMDMKKTAAGEIMTAAVETVEENDHVRDVFAVMKRARVRRVPVINAGGRLVGIIAQADLAVTYAGLDLQRETEVEEVIERISEPARPRWGRDEGAEPRHSRISRGALAKLDLPDRFRQSWNALRREGRQIIGKGYDRDWR
jgi:CBS domain-containing protein